MEQQRSTIVKHIIRCFNCLPLSLTSVSPNRHWPPAGCLTNRHSDVASTHQYLGQNFNRLAPAVGYCRDSVIYILKFGMLGSHRLGATIAVRHLETKLLDGCACTVRAGLLYC